MAITSPTDTSLENWNENVEMIQQKDVVAGQHTEAKT